MGFHWDGNMRAEEDESRLSEGILIVTDSVLDREVGLPVVVWIADHLYTVVAFLLWWSLLQVLL